MPRFYGGVGFAVDSTTSPGIVEQIVVERVYSGDVTKIYGRFESGEKINDDANISNVISIIGDPYAHERLFAIRYVTWMGVRWKVNSIEVDRPRIKLSIGGVYNGPEPETTTTTAL